MKLDLTKPMQQRDGELVQIIYKKAIGDYPIIGLILNHEQHQVPRSWTKSGSYMRNFGVDSWDLINVPTKRKGKK